MSADPRHDSVPTPPGEGDTNFHTTRRTLGLATIMFWSIIPVLLIGIIVIIFFAM